MKDDTRATWEWMQTKASGTGHDIAADTAKVLNFVEDARMPTTEASLEWLRRAPSNSRTVPTPIVEEARCLHCTSTENVWGCRGDQFPLRSMPPSWACPQRSSLKPKALRAARVWRSNAEPDENSRMPEYWFIACVQRNLSIWASEDMNLKGKEAYLPYLEPRMG